MPKLKQIKTMENLCVIDAIQMQTDSLVILKARGRLGLPHKIIRVNENCFCSDDEGNTTIFKKGDYIAAYRCAGSEKSSGNFYVVRLTKEDLEKINTILERRFQSSLNKEQASNILPSISDLPFFTVFKDTIHGLSLKSKELYASDGRSSTRLSSIIRLTEDVSFFVSDTINLNKKHLYQAHQGDVFCVLKGDNYTTARLVLTSKEDVPAIKMQEKKEKILRKQGGKKITPKTVLKAFRRKKIEKMRNR